MNSQQAMKILTPQFWKIAKSNGEQLWMHHYTVWHIFKKMLEVGVLPSLDEKQEILEVACLIHDWKKHAPWNQLILFGEKDTDRIVDSYIKWWQEKGVPTDVKDVKDKIKKLFGSGRTDHQIETEKDLDYILKPYLEFVKNELPFELREDKTRMVFEIIKHHFLKEEDISKAELPGFGNYIYILKLCDRLASMETVDVNTINQLRSINELGRQIFDVTYFTISRKFGPSTALISDILFKHYKECGWIPLLYFEDGGVLITKGKGKPPDKQNILKDTYSSFLKKSLEELPTEYNSRKTMLTGVAADHPKGFIYAHQDEVIKRLNESDVGLTFFKFLVEMLDNGGYNTKRIRENYPVLDVLFGLCIGTRGIALAFEKWKRYKDESLPLKKDRGGIEKRASLNHIFNSTTIEEVIPSPLREKLPKNLRLLKESSAQELFDTLLNLAGQFEKETDRDHKIKRYLNEIISMEEEKDFRAIAQERFTQYKAYKAKPTEKKTGVCEICGCTVIQKPGAGSAKGQIQAFSQIKARSDIPRKICPFCDYDSNVMREGVGNWIPIYVRISSRIPLEFRQDISEKIIKPLKDGIIRVQNIEDMQKRWGVLFPPVPILVGERDYDVVDYVATTERTGIISRIDLVDSEEFSPKDQKAKYEPLYHLLNLLGFRVSIGAEEQNGLFGENILTIEQSYLNSLAVILLSSTIEKKRRYLFAKDLLERSPSVAITYTASETKDKKGQTHLRMKEELAKKFFSFLCKSEIILFKNGGEYQMKELLEDADFFADYIPKFCWDDKERKRWNTGKTKYLATKAVSQALNQMMQRGEFEVSFAKFLSHIREDIARDKNVSGTITDEKELEVSTHKAKEILKRYFQLREKNITEFIRVKNALLSAVYVFKRYENLKEVCK